MNFQVYLCSILISRVCMTMLAMSLTLPLKSFALSLLHSSLFLMNVPEETPSQFGPTASKVISSVSQEQALELP